MSSQIVSIAQNAASLIAGTKHDGYSKVIWHVTEDLAYTVGNDMGMTLEVTMPFGTREMAQNLLNELTGYQYQSFDATDALLDPAVQLGDALDVNGIYGGIYSMRSKMGKLFAADVGAPEIKQIEQKAKFKPSKDRQIVRQLDSLTTELRIQAGLISAEVEERKSEVEKLDAALKVQVKEISAKVSKTGGDRGSFAWVLEYDNWTVYSNNSVVFRLMKGLAELTGKIVATSGKIGGFDILRDYLSYNGQTWGGTNTTGGYFGTSGLQLGKNFKVDMQGNLYAKSGTFDGWIKAGRIDYGGDAGYFSGEGLSSRSVGGGKIGYNTISTSNTSGGINTSLGYADYANGVFQGWNTPSRLIVGSLTASNYFYFGNVRVTRQSATVRLADGGTKTITYMAC